MKTLSDLEKSEVVMTMRKLAKLSPHLPGLSRQDYFPRPFAVTLRSRFGGHPSPSAGHLTRFEYTPLTAGSKAFHLEYDGRLSSFSSLTSCPAEAPLSVVVLPVGIVSIRGDGAERWESFPDLPGLKHFGAVRVITESPWLLREESLPEDIQACAKVGNLLLSGPDPSFCLSDIPKSYLRNSTLLDLAIGFGNMEVSFPELQPWYVASGTNSREVDFEEKLRFYFMCEGNPSQKIPLGKLVTNCRFQDGFCQDKKYFCEHAQTPSWFYAGGELKYGPIYPSLALMVEGLDPLVKPGKFLT